MKAFLVLAVLISVSVTAECFLFSDVACAILPATCSSYLSTISQASTCTEKRPYFKCLQDNNCKSGTIYEAQVTAFDYSKCGASGLLISSTLLVVMTVVAKLFSN
ncbi:hypothetical protein SNE40_003829 [Patella caerulea]|uniref:Uncharacterized protein n=1 Tax=Patella caerulea TaxID=87958 RepID=A0AAN8Q0P5_PATCE